MEKIIKLFVAIAILMACGYYLYDSYQVKQTKKENEEFEEIQRQWQRETDSIKNHYEKEIMYREAGL